MHLLEMCHTNHGLYRKFAFLPNFYGGSPLPEGWKDHPECSFCHDLSYYITAKHALHPDNRAKHPQAANSSTEYAYTLTMPPDYQPKKPLEERARMIMNYGLTSKPYEKATQYAYVLEHTEKGVPHIHGVYKTASGRRIANKYFKRYHDLWDPTVKLGHGHKGGYHEKARHAESYAAYLNKEGVVIKSKSPAISGSNCSLVPQDEVEELDMDELISYV